MANSEFNFEIKERNGVQSVVIDLSPKTEGHNPDRANGREVLRHVYYRVRVPYYLDSMHDNSQDIRNKEDESVMAFFIEVRDILKAAGWNVIYFPELRSDDCPRMSKGNQWLYIHSQSLSGYVAADQVEIIGDLMKGAKSFKHYHTDNYRDVVVVQDIEDAKALYHEQYDATIMQLVQDATTTKRRNLYKNRASVEHYIGNRIDIKMTFVGKEFFTAYPHLGYAALKIDEAIALGLIVTADNGRLIRWLNKAEQKAWERQHRLA